MAVAPQFGKARIIFLCTMSGREGDCRDDGHYALSDQQSAGSRPRRLIRAGAPKDFAFHACRHTLATWLQNQGHSEWERGLVLNHAGTGSVTAGYSHGYPAKLKLELLSEWAAHVEKLVQPEGDGVVNALEDHVSHL